MNSSESIGCAAEPHGERPSSHSFVQKLFNHYLSLPKYLHPRNSKKKGPSPVYSKFYSQTKYNIIALPFYFSSSILTAGTPNVKCNQ